MKLMISDFMIEGFGSAYRQMKFILSDSSRPRFGCSLTLNRNSGFGSYINRLVQDS